MSKKSEEETIIVDSMMKFINGGVQLNNTLKQKND